MAGPRPCCLFLPSKGLKMHYASATSSRVTQLPSQQPFSHSDESPARISDAALDAGLVTWEQQPLAAALREVVLEALPASFDAESRFLDLRKLQAKLVACEATRDLSVFDLLRDQAFGSMLISFTGENLARL